MGGWGAPYERGTVYLSSVPRYSANTYLTEMCSGSEADSHLRLIDFVYHSTLGLRVMKKKKQKILHFGGRVGLERNVILRFDAVLKNECCINRFQT